MADRMSSLAAQNASRNATAHATALERKGKLSDADAATLKDGKVTDADFAIAEQVLDKANRNYEGRGPRKKHPHPNPTRDLAQGLISALHMQKSLEQSPPGPLAAGIAAAGQWLQAVQTEGQIGRAANRFSPEELKGGH